MTILYIVHVPFVEDNIHYLVPLTEHMVPVGTISVTAYRVYGTCYRGEYLVPLTEPMVPVIEDNIWYCLQSPWYLLQRTISGTAYRAHGTCYTVEDNIWYRLQSTW
jgi:hypothetical protein